MITVKTWPKCQVCKDNGEDHDAVVLAPASSDQGKTIDWLPICEFEMYWWWDGSDWFGDFVRLSREPVK